MRNRQTTTQLLKEIALLMGYELTRDLPTTLETIDTPLREMDAPVIVGRKLAVVPIPRVGIGMADGLLERVPDVAGRTGCRSFGFRAVTAVTVARPDAGRSG